MRCPSHPETCKESLRETMQSPAAGRSLFTTKLRTPQTSSRTQASFSAPSFMGSPEESTLLGKVKASDLTESPPQFAELVLESEANLPIPALKWCAACGAESCTEVMYAPSRRTFWTSVGVFLLGGVAGCFMLPYMSSSCQDMKVVCGRCKHPL